MCKGCAQGVAHDYGLPAQEGHGEVERLGQVEAGHVSREQNVGPDRGIEKRLFHDNGTLSIQTRIERHEQIVGMAYIAAKTSRIRLVAAVLVVLPPQPETATHKTTQNASRAAKRWCGDTGMRRFTRTHSGMRRS